MNRGRSSILFNSGNSYLKRENSWVTLTKLRAFLGSTGSHSLEFHARHAGKMVISSFPRTTTAFALILPFAKGKRPIAEVGVLKLLLCDPPIGHVSAIVGFTFHNTKGKAPGIGLSVLTLCARIYPD